MSVQSDVNQFHRIGVTSMKIFFLVVYIFSMFQLPAYAANDLVLTKRFVLNYSDSKIKKYQGNRDLAFYQMHTYSMFLVFHAYYENILRTVKENQLIPSKGLVDIYFQVSNASEIISQHLSLSHALRSNRIYTDGYLSFAESTDLTEMKIRGIYYDSANSSYENILDKIYQNSMEQISVLMAYDEIFGSVKKWEIFKSRYFSELIQSHYEEVSPWISLFDKLTQAMENFGSDRVIANSLIVKPKNDDKFLEELVHEITSGLEAFGERRPSADQLYELVQRSILKIYMKREPF